VDEWKRIIQSAQNNDPLAIPWFDIPIVFSGQGVAVRTTTLKACEFKEDPLAANQGDTKLLVKIQLIIGGIKHIN
jgi:hypothetical protein